MPRHLGRRPYVNDPRVPPLRDMVTREDAPPMDCNWWASVGDWPMMLNDTLGVCCEAAVGHAILQRTTYAGAPVTLPDQAIEELYRSWGGYDGTPATDHGTVMSAAMLAWATAGVPLSATIDVLEGYAQVDHLSTDWLRHAIWQFGSVLMGINLPSAWLQSTYLFDLPNGAEDIAGGHAVTLVGYETTALGIEYDMITWGFRGRMTERAALLVADEAYALLDRDFMNVRGIDPAGVDWAIRETAMARIRST